jgi:hypothetical protein
VVERAAEIGQAAAFDLALMAPNLPPFRAAGPISVMTEMVPRHVTEEGARRHGSVPTEDLSCGPSVDDDRPRTARSTARLRRVLPIV